MNARYIIQDWCAILTAEYVSIPAKSLQWQPIRLCRCREVILYHRSDAVKIRASVREILPRTPFVMIAYPAYNLDFGLN